MTNRRLISITACWWFAALKFIHQAVGKPPLVQVPGFSGIAMLKTFAVLSTEID